MSEAVNPANDQADLDSEMFTRSDVDVLYQIYMEKRVAAQVSFYESRMRENQLNADFTFTMGALVMTVSSLVATISASGGSSYLSLISAILPAFAALLGSFRQLYGWERQISIYRDSLLGLERVKLLSPDDDRIAKSNLEEIYPKLVTNSETVFTGEINQWGQFILEKDRGEEEETQDSRALASLLDNLSDEQKSIIAAIMTAGNNKTDTPLVITTEKSSPAALPTNAASSNEVPPPTPPATTPPDENEGEQTSAG